MPYLPNSGASNGLLSPNAPPTHSTYRLSEENKKSNMDWKFYRTPINSFQGQRRNSVAELSEDDRQTVHEEWQI